jgi:hypothetical protein
MNEWGAGEYGDPCRDCGFPWSTSFEESVAIVVGLPEVYGRTLAGLSGTERHPDLGWSVTEYVLHVADNLRIWAERLMGVVAGGPEHVGAYDENELADARHYEAISVQAAMWSLTRAVGDWREAMAEADRAGAELVHPERGPQTAEQVAAATAHDAFHHYWDIKRSVG